MAASSEPVDPSDPPGLAAPGAFGERSVGSESSAEAAATFCATLVDEWVRAGLTDAVVAPGSRSTPMVLALIDRPELRVSVFHDERSAAFSALGLSSATRRPTLVLCTSGTAAVEFHAAVVEAHQSSVPLLVVTADRPAELVERGAPQTIDQRELYGSAARWYCEPGPPQMSGAAWWRDLARDAWHRTGGLRPGPVHVNLAFREPLIGVAAPLPPARDPLPRVPVGARWGVTDEDLGRLAQAVSGCRGVIVAGARATLDPIGADLDDAAADDAADESFGHSAGDDAAAIHDLAEHLGWPVLADGLSGVRWPSPLVCTTFDGIVRHQRFAERHRPEFVIHIGARLASKEVNRWLATTRGIQVAVDRFGHSADPDGTLAQSFTADVATFCDQLRAVAPEPAPSEWIEDWTAADVAARAAITGVLARHSTAIEPAVAADVVAMAKDGSALVASSSMPIRDLEWYAPARWGLSMLANRGANGIDGVTSTAVGVALAGQPTILLTGDVAFLHDTNALLGLARRPVDLLIVVVDNDGGGIFHFLPQREHLAAEAFESLFGTPHGVDLTAIAAAHGIPAERVSSRAGLQAAVAGALTRRGTRVVVVEGDRVANVAVHEELQAAIGAALDHLA